MMVKDLLFGVSALFALLPVGLSGLRPAGGRDGPFWSTLAVAVAGPLAWVLAETGGVWRTGFSITLWVTVAASMGLFAMTAIASRQAWRLAPLVSGYLACLSLFALVWQHAPEARLNTTAPTAWMHTHILVSVATYGLVTLAGIAALAAFLQERALKAKRPTPITRRLPSVADSEALVLRLLMMGEVVLGLGLATGMALQYSETRVLLRFDHKTVLTVGAFVVIGGLLVFRWRTGARGRMVARLVLLAYLLLTLGYPGVKFVTDVLMR